MKYHTKLLLIAAFFVLALPMVLTVGTAQAAAPFLLDDGAGLKDNGQWQVIDPGSCVSNGAQTTRAACTAEDFTGTYGNGPDCVDTPYCTDPTYLNATDCNAAAYNWITVRLWNGSQCRGNWPNKRVYGPSSASTGACSMPEYTSLTNCTTASGTWTTTSYNDPYFNESQRVQCLHCHNDAYGTHALATFGNGSSQETYFRTGHRNVLRKVTDKSDLSGKIPLGGPIYTDDPTGHSPYTNVDWATGLSGTQTNYYVYNSWFSAMKVNQIEGDALADATTVSTVTNFSGARTCFYCHTSAYGQNDPSFPAQEARYPLAGETFEPGVTGTGTLYKFEIGITCVTCHKGAGNLWTDYNIEHHTATSTNDFGAYPIFEEGTALCMTCHRLEDTSGSITTVAVQDDALLIEGLEDHHGNIGAQFLQSPHAKFTGTYTQIQDPSMYSSNFSLPGSACSDPQYHGQTTCTTNGGTWSATGVDHNMGCQECHNPHVSSVDPETIDPTTSQTQLVNYCVDCHANPSDTLGAPQIVVADINHPTGPNTPLSGLSSQEKSVQMACIRCHMSDRINHLFKVNTNPSYSTFTSLCSDTQYETRTTCTANSGTWSDMSMEFGSLGVPAPSGFVELSVNWACGWCHQDPAKVGADKVFNKAQMSAAAIGMHVGVPTGNCTLCHDDIIQSGAGRNHHSGACTDCHGTPTYPLHVGATIIDRASRDTIGTSCIACHPSIIPSGASDNHHRGHNTADAPLVGIGCLACHGANGGVPTSDTSTNLSLPGAAHQDAGAEGTVSATSKLCVVCHSETDAGHGNFIQSGTGQNHHKGNCTTCHKTDGSHTDGAPGAGVTTPAPATVVDCTKCHNESVPAMKHPAAAMFLALSCDDCHAIPDTSYVGRKPGIEVCAQCHGDGGVWPLTNEVLTAWVPGMHQMTPDLVIANIFAASATVPSGGSVNVTEITKNMSVGGTAGASTTVFYVSSTCTTTPSGSTAATRLVGMLGPGATSTMTTSVPMGSTPGTYYVIAKADGAGAGVVTESSESNNTRCSAAITVTGGALPDLVVTAVAAPVSATHGNSISVSDRTQNIGTVLAAASKTRVYINGSCSLSGATALNTPGRAVPSLIATGSSTATYSVTLPAGTGPQQLIWNADDGGVVGETNEGNNIKCKAINVL